MDQWIHYHLKFTFYSRTPPHYGFMENLLFESFFLMMFTSKVMPICSFTSVLSLPWLDLHGCSFLVKALQSCKHSLKKLKYFWIMLIWLTCGAYEISPIVSTTRLQIVTELSCCCDISHFFIWLFLSCNQGAHTCGLLEFEL